MRISAAMLFHQVLLFKNSVLSHILYNSCAIPGLLIPSLLPAVFLLAQLASKTVFIWLGDRLALVHKALFQDT
jgi:hypothetical protein